jgi:hypothetical protein
MRQGRAIRLQRIELGATLPAAADRHSEGEALRGARRASYFLTALTGWSSILRPPRRVSSARIRAARSHLGKGRLITSTFWLQVFGVLTIAAGMILTPDASRFRSGARDCSIYLSVFVISSLLIPAFRDVDLVPVWGHGVRL